MPARLDLNSGSNWTSFMAFSTSCPVPVLLCLASGEEDAVEN
jgi:hypothetical protein